MARIYIAKDENGEAQLVLDGFDLSRGLLGGALHLEGVGMPMFCNCIVREDTAILIWNKHDGSELLASVLGDQADLESAEQENRTGDVLISQSPRWAQPARRTYEPIHGSITLEDLAKGKTT